ncbi:hypothetical protein H0H81_006822 [Sphagnurus paluster]|uniref:Serine aminopeptidase S33 domain-containing protein n=1 Tax=Sphagnurus paluster TaxID=117069 RepID=A0A9P7FT44_9AGAR|nr:hypothetical protein H0H81_006822 [Sphagnurus paluster]
MIGIPYLAPLLHTPDGVRLSCFLLPQTRECLVSGYTSGPVPDERVVLTPAAAEARATVIVFHGNSAQNWEDMQTPKDLFEMRCNVFLLSYRGWHVGRDTKREGYVVRAVLENLRLRAGAAGLRIDAQTALDYILSQPYLAATPIVVYGHSLGGGVAIDLASRNPTKIAAIIVSNTFTSIPDIVRRWPHIGMFAFVCHQKWPSAQRLESVPPTTPILMLSGRRDEIIAPELMDQLWAAARKRGRLRRSGVALCGGCNSGRNVDELEVHPEGDLFVEIETGTHNDTPVDPAYWDAVRQFICGLPMQKVVHIPDPGPDMSVDDTRWRYVNQDIEVICL